MFTCLGTRPGSKTFDWNLMLARKVHERGFKVALTGEGADEWMAGYPWYKIQRLLGMLDFIPGVPLSGVARRAYLGLTGAPKVAWDAAHKVQQIGRASC